jgi:hypothetical protein
VTRPGDPPASEPTGLFAEAQRIRHLIGWAVVKPVPVFQCTECLTTGTTELVHEPGCSFCDPAKPVPPARRVVRDPPAGPPPVPVAYPYCDTCKGEVSSFVLHTDQEGLARPGPVDFELRPCGHRSTYTSPPGYELHGRAVRDR